MNPERLSAAIRDYVDSMGMSQPLRELEEDVDQVFSSSSPTASYFGLLDSY